MRRLVWSFAVALSLGSPTIAMAQVNLTSAGGFLFDVETEFLPGSLSNGTTDAYDSCYSLRVGGLDYSPIGSPTMSLGDRQIELPTASLAGLSVSRLVYVPATGGDYARYLEVLENTGPSPVTTTVEISGNLGSDSGTRVTGSSSGDSAVSVADGWFTTDDGIDSGGDPSLAHVFGGPTASIDPSAVSLSFDDLSYAWSVTVPAGGRVVLMHFAVQASDDATAIAEARRLVEAPDDALDGTDDFIDDVVNFGVAVPGAPRARFTSGFEVEEGEEVAVSVVVEDPDGDALTFTWDLDDDGTFGESPGAASVRLPASDGPGAIRVGVEATDARGNTSQRYRTIRVVNVAPRVTSTPPLSTSVAAELRYTVETFDPAGALDPPRFTLVRGPTRMTLSDTGLLQWVATEADVTVAGETHHVEISVDDGDEGMTTQRWELMVSPNRAPTPPIPAYPIDHVAILDPMPRLAAQNSEDGDLDPLTYTFQLDAVETFDSPELQAWTVPEMPGFTSVQLEAPLPIERLYFWRVKSNDGTADSEWRATTFWVIHDPLLPRPDAGFDAGDVPDAGVGVDAGMGMGGGCAVGGSGSAGWLIGLLGLMGLVMRRR